MAQVIENGSGQMRNDSIPVDDFGQRPWFVPSRFDNVHYVK